DGAAVRSIGIQVETSLDEQHPGVGIATAERALGAVVRPYLALLLEAGSRTMQGEAAVGTALIDALDTLEQAFRRLARGPPPGSRPRPRGSPPPRPPPPPP